MSKMWGGTKKVRDVLEGGNWDSIGAGSLYIRRASIIRGRELFGVSRPDLEGLPDRWIKIVKGRVKWAR